MEVFRGRAHIPGADKEWHIKLEIDWGQKEVDVSIDEAPGGVKERPGLAIQTFGPMDEIAFRTKGIPTLFTHWWHFVRSAGGDLQGVVLGLPDVNGIWQTCMLSMEKVKA